MEQLCLLTSANVDTELLFLWKCTATSIVKLLNRRFNCGSDPRRRRGIVFVSRYVYLFT